jgi:hypothetical protein
VSATFGPVSDELRFGFSLPLPGSPLAALNAVVDGELAAGEIACACPHPGTADRLAMPGRLLGCDDCIRAMQRATEELDGRHACACCGQPATGASVWMSGTVFVLAWVCPRCSKAGNAAQSLN